MKNHQIVLLGEFDELDSEFIAFESIYSSVVFGSIPTFDDVYDAYLSAVIEQSCETDNVHYLNYSKGEDDDQNAHANVGAIKKPEADIFNYLMRRRYSFYVGKKEIFNAPVKGAW